MHSFTQASLDHLKSKWHTELVGSGKAADALGINPATLRSRLARGQALCLRDEDGRARASISFTGFHMIYNYVSDRLFRFGFSDGEGPEGVPAIANTLTQWVEDHILGGEHSVNAVVSILRDGDGKAVYHVYEAGEFEQFSGEATVFLPIGSFVLRFAAQQYAISGDPNYARHFSEPAKV